MSPKQSDKIKYGVLGFSSAILLAIGGLQLQSASAIPPNPPAATPSAATAPAVVTGAFEPNLYVSLAKKAVPSVVNISTATLQNSRPEMRGESPEEFFRRFFGGGDERGRGLPLDPRSPRSNPGEPVRRMMSLGTGFIIEDSGIILTNHHVVKGADEIQIQFTEDANEKPVTAKVIGSDPGLDIALLKVNTDRKLTALQLGDSDALEVGEYVMAVGNPFGQGHSVTHGIISAKGRIAPEFPLANYLQTDAPINPGNSGGPLLNLKGQVIGINNAIDARAQGIGFAIPVNAVKSVLTQLKQDGKVSRGYLGVLVEPLHPQLAKNLGLPKDIQGPVVAQAEPGQPAFQAGIRPYDVILTVNGKSVNSPSELMSTVAATPAGKSIAVKVNRGGKEMTYDVRLAQRPT